MAESLSQLKLDQRAKELDAQEEYLAKREDLLKSAPISIKVLEETIRVKQQQANTVEDKIAAAEKAYQVYVATLKDKIAIVEEHLATTQQELNNLDSLRAASEIRNQGLTKTAKDLKRDITDSKAYKSEQDKLITESIEEGNMTLRALQYEIDGREEIKKTVNYEIAILMTSRDEVDVSIAHTQQYLNDLVGSYEETNEKFQESLSAVKNTLRQNTATNKQVTADTEKKLAQLHLKEESILAKLRSIDKEREELETDKRRWNSSKGLYGSV